MSVIATLYQSGEFHELEGYAHLGDAIRDVLESWNEDEGTFLVLLADAATGSPYGSMVRGEPDGELCYVGLCDGSYYRYRSHYVLDNEGRYLRTEVTLLAMSGKAAGGADAGGIPAPAIVADGLVHTI